MCFKALAIIFLDQSKTLRFTQGSLRSHIDPQIDRDDENDFFFLNLPQNPSLFTLINNYLSVVNDC